jgi:hypothetical protein
MMCKCGCMEALARNVAETAQRHADAARVAVEGLLAATRKHDADKLRRRIRPIRGVL